MNQQYPQYPQQPPHGNPPQGPPGYYGMPPQQPPPPKGISIGRIIAGVVSGLVIVGVVIFFLGTFGGRGGGSNATDSPMFTALTDPVVINEQFPLKDGAGKVLKLEPGTYRVEITATGDGASIEWAGAACTQAKKTKVYNTTCTVTQTSQMTIMNPTLLGLGSDVMATVKVTRLP